MKTALYNYDIYPKVFRQDVPVQITVRPLGRHAAFLPGVEYEVQIMPLDELRYGEDGDCDPAIERQMISPCEDGALRFEQIFHGEQEHFIRIFKDGTRIVELSVYSVGEDLSNRYPYMGDLHVHTFRSDGRQAPPVVAADYRQRGYDFLSITDHHAYHGSLEAIRSYEGVPIDLNLVPGEEVHLPGNDIHIVNFGGLYSVNALVDHKMAYLNEKCPGITERPDDQWRVFGDTPARPMMSTLDFKQMIRDLRDTLTIPEGVDGYTYAACVWSFNEIRKAGGLGIFAHPYWIANVFHVPVRMTEYLFETQPFDAFEVLGGERYLDQNETQIYHYMDARAKGRRFPIVGSSDSHGVYNNENVDLGKTIVFAPENTREALIDSIKDYFSVAVDCISKEYRLAGELRLIRYGRFVMDNFFPLHDMLCYEEGRLMKDYCCGVNVERTEALLGLLHGRTKEQMTKYFQF